MLMEHNNRMHADGLMKECICIALLCVLQVCFCCCDLAWMAVDVAWWLLEQLRHDASERTITKFIYIYIYIYVYIYIYIYE